jgi:hypothetical protein
MYCDKFRRNNEENRTPPNNGGQKNINSKPCTLNPKFTQADFLMLMQDLEKFDLSSSALLNCRNRIIASFCVEIIKPEGQ